MAEFDNPYPFRGTPAADMLSRALSKYSDQPGKSIRKLGALLGYKQAAILSHMATGRVPIPLDRAAELAQALEMPEGRFVSEVLKQRHPEAYAALVRKPPEERHLLVVDTDVDALGLSPVQARIIREVGRDMRPQERWMSIPELEVMELIRAACPHVSVEGLTRDELNAISIGLEHLT
jgi:hypothetical protein